MSLLMLSSIQDSEWYIPTDYSPFGAKSSATKKFSPREITKRKCKEIAFYMTELPVVQHHKYNMWKYFDRKYVYSQVIDIVIQKNPRNVFQKNAMRRTVRLV